MDFDFPKRNITNELRLIFAIRVIRTSVFSFSFYFSFFQPFKLHLIFIEIFLYILAEMMSQIDYLYLLMQDISDKTLVTFSYLLHQLIAHIPTCLLLFLKKQG